MRRLSTLLIVASVSAGCGDDGSSGAPDAPPSDAALDAPSSSCASIPAMGQLTARDGNPRLRAGHAFADGGLDLAISDPDVRFAAERNRYEAYYATTHAADAQGTGGRAVIRHVTSVDKQTWDFVETPALLATTEPAAWDAGSLDAPTVAYDAAASPERRYVMLYAAAGAIGAAFSPDGATFTRAPAAQSVGGNPGLVLQVAGTALADPELALVAGTYHLFFALRSATAVGIGHATSPDALTWTIAEAPIPSLQRRQADPRTGGWAPSVLYDAVHCRWELWLANDVASDVSAQPVALASTAGLYRAESLTGVTWNIDYARNRDFSWNSASPRGGERGGLRSGADLAAAGTGRLLLYVGYDDQDVPPGFTLPQRAGGTAPGVMSLNIATRDLP